MGADASTATDLMGRALRDLRVSVTDRCNFRCPYCMPPETRGHSYQFIPKPELLSFEEIVRLVEIFTRLGTRKVKITGGEPLVRNNLERLVAGLAAVSDIEDLTLTTNGYLLEQAADGLAEAGLDRVTVSLDSLDQDVFGQLNGRGLEVGPVLDGIAAAEAAGLTPIKINCVVMRGINEGSVLALAERFHGSGHIVRFIEFMDVGTRNGWNRDRVVGADEIIGTVNARFPLEPVEASYTGEVATRYRYKDGGGEVGVIPSVTRPFCGACTRARISTDGRLVTCLFAEAGTDLKTPMRCGASDQELEELIAATWHARDDRYSELRAGGTAATGHIEMYELGG